MTDFIKSFNYNGISHPIAADYDGAGKVIATTYIAQNEAQALIETSVGTTVEDKITPILDTKFDNVKYNSQNKTIDFYVGDVIKTIIDAKDFVKDGMINTVSIENNSLIITFNTDAGKDTITVSLADIFDANNYYNKTQIDSIFALKSNIPTKTSQLTNDSHYISAESDPVFKASPAAKITDTDISSWNNKGSFSGDYNDLTNKPTIPTAVSQLTNDSGYLTKHQDLSKYAKTEQIPTKTSQLTNDSGFLTEHQSLTDYAKTTDIPTNVSQLTNDSEYTTKAYVTQAIEDAASGDIDLSKYATKIYVKTEISNIDLSEYAKSTNIPTKTSQLTNDSEFITTTSLNDYAKSTDIPTKTSDLTNDSGYLIEHQSLADYVTKTDLTTATSDLLSKTDASTIYQPKGEYLTSVTTSDITDWNTATSNFITDISGKQDALTENQLTNLNADHSKYLTEHQSLAGYATESYVNTATSSLLSKTDAESTYQPKGNYITDISSKQDKLTDAQLSNLNEDHSKYLTEHQDLSNYATIAYVDARVWVGTEAEYSALETTESNVLYLIKET